MPPSRSPETALLDTHTTSQPEASFPHKIKRQTKSHLPHPHNTPSRPSSDPPLLKIHIPHRPILTHMDIHPTTRTPTVSSLSLSLSLSPSPSPNTTQRNATQRNATQRNATQRNATQRRRDPYLSRLKSCVSIDPSSTTRCSLGRSLRAKF